MINRLKQHIINSETRLELENKRLTKQVRALKAKVKRLSDDALAWREFKAAYADADNVKEYNPNWMYKQGEQCTVNSMKYKLIRTTLLGSIMGKHPTTSPLYWEWIK